MKNFEQAFLCVKPLGAIGCEFRGEIGISRRHYFNKGRRGDLRTHQVHMVEIDSWDWQAALAFGDYLRQHPEAAEEYAELKLKLAEQFRADKEAYTEAKGPFIMRTLEMAGHTRPRIYEAG